MTSESRGEPPEYKPLCTGRSGLLRRMHNLSGPGGVGGAGGFKLRASPRLQEMWGRDRYLSYNRQTHQMTQLDIYRMLFGSYFSHLHLAIIPYTSSI